MCLLSAIYTSLDQHHLQASEQPEKLCIGSYVIIRPLQLCGAQKSLCAGKVVIWSYSFNPSARQKHTANLKPCTSESPSWLLKQNPTASQLLTLPGSRSGCYQTNQRGHWTLYFAGSLTKFHSGKSCQNLFMLIIPQTLLNDMMNTHKMDSCSC